MDNVEKAIKQDREFTSAILRALPGGMSVEERQRWIGDLAGLQKGLRELLCPSNGDKVKKEGFSNPYLRLLYEGEHITLPVTGGQRLIADAKKVFTWGIDGDFRNWGADQPGEHRLQMEVKVLEMYQNATFSQMFNSFGKSLDELCFTQDQIIAFCENHKDRLRRDGYGTFFLFKSNGKLFVAHVNVLGAGRLGVLVHEFGHDDVWYGVRQHGVVVPATALVA